MSEDVAQGVRRPGLYIHVPFCSAICPYCDFAVLTGGPARRAAFVDAVVAEIAMWRGEAESWGVFDTVYLGGGTPSALAASEIERILAAARAALPLADDAWITMEANPEDVDAESLRQWAGLGVSMLSLGVQSFDAGALRFLGRRHSPDQARRAVADALDAGFPTVSVDLIYGEGGNDGPEARWRRDLEAATALGPQHLSCYQLTVHEGTPFGFRAARGSLRELPEDVQARLFRLTHTALAERGYVAYEVSNFARAGEAPSRHNSKYWDHTPYLGLGPSAHSFDGTRRWWNERKLGAWQTRIAAGERPLAGDEELTRDQLALEEVMLSLRTAAGLDLAGFRRRHGVDLAARNRRLVEEMIAGGLAARIGERLVPTLDGLAVADSLARSFEIEGEGELGDG
jgi:oxygen-independent coproporphyrinogen-3 oxidase